ncbi:hypothetical protein EVAR_58776_1 [Eumeta japonica]|uniref:Uncharacterized protein n=1 Tax=Eumeta variegata TaxID=151549 RepID=A0A4C1YMD6_EUMVA|nr:hypothetical protein EVAR_58776_1 [Eumeta japonica]
MGLEHESLFSAENGFSGINSSELNQKTEPGSRSRSGSKSKAGSRSGSCLATRSVNIEDSRGRQQQACAGGDVVAAQARSAEVPRGAPLALAVNFACVFFWQRALTLDFFVAKRSVHVRARASASRRARREWSVPRCAPHSPRPNFLHSNGAKSFRRSRGRIRERGSRRHGATRAHPATRRAAPRPRPRRAAHAEVASATARSTPRVNAPTRAT